MGGKSTFLRQIALISMLAQIGSFVPCTEAILPLFDNILTRVGASDQPLSGISTFMAEMIDTSHILEEATCKSLVLIDELGRGTSTFDGFGLAYAITKELLSRNCWGLFATHFHELTQMDVGTLYMECLLQENDVVLMYKVKEGVGESFGLNCAKVVGFPEKVVQLAKKKVDELDSGIGELDGSLDEKMRQFAEIDFNSGVEFNLREVENIFS
jgi:DNA mismatch repair protein MSH2